jgi:phosphate/sulfate permease
MVLVTGGIAGLLGAAIWASISYFFNYEIGWIAWGIGAMVGGGVVMGGGKGNGAALIACLITVLSICGGKIAGIHFAIQSSDLSSEIEASITIADYNLAKQEAAAFVALESRAQYPAFMVQYEYTDATSPGSITQGEITEFEDNNLEYLQDFNANPPSFEEWKAVQVALIREFLQTDFSYMEMLKASLSLFDIIFFLLALITAYKIIPEGEEVGYIASE